MLAGRIKTEKRTQGRIRGRHNGKGRVVVAAAVSVRKSYRISCTGGI